MFINVELLKSKNACHSQVSLFKKLFPNGVVVTTDLCIEYYNKFSWNWAARNLLSKTGWKEYDKIRVAAYNEYKKTKDAAWGEYRKIHDVAMVEYLKIHDVAWVEYLKLCAKTFGKLAVNS